jgi:hypothetical protein
VDAGAEAAGQIAVEPGRGRWPGGETPESVAGSGNIANSSSNSRVPDGRIEGELAEDAAGWQMQRALPLQVDDPAAATGIGTTGSMRRVIR